MNQNIDELADQMYDKLKNERSITQFLVMRYAGVDFNTANDICHKIWRRLKAEARQYAHEFNCR